MKRGWLLSISLPLIAFVVVFMNSGLTHAAPFGRPVHIGYFHNKQQDWGDDLFDNGIYTADVQSFLNTYWGALYSPNVKDRVAAEFTILTMLGYPVNTADWTVARAEFGRWEQIVRWYGNNGRINWGRAYPYTFNTYYQPAHYDVAWYIEPDTRDSIVFTNPDGSTYAIKKDCANPVGDMSPLEQPKPDPPPTGVQCGTMTATPNPVELGRSIAVVVRPSYSGGEGPASVTNGYIRVTGPGFSSTWPLAPNPGPPDGPGGGSMTFTSPAFTPPQAGVYTVTWDLRVNGVAPNPSPCGGSGNVNYDSFRVMKYPYFEVSGGDVVAGAGIVTNAGQDCGTTLKNTRAGVSGWNSSTAPYTTGAGGQYATFAWDFIQEFASNKGSGRPPNYLSFANDGSSQTNISSGRYGGFGRPVACIDQWADVPASANPVPNPSGVNLNALPNGVYSHPGNLTISRSTLAANKKLTIYVSGDVRIADDIWFGGAFPTWSSLTEIPTFKLIVRGTIHIGSNVNRIDGSYVAVPATSNYTTLSNNYSPVQPGTISTCSSGFTVLNPAVAPVSMISSCNRRLEVNGSLSANQILFLRTFGTLTGGPSAEVINYTPEMWLAPTQTDRIDPTYQSVVGLPPVL